MKIEQHKPKYQPITITLETQEEAEALWAVLEDREDKPQKRLITYIANWFCHHAKL